MEPGLQLDRVQGNILPGFGAASQAFLWLHFPSEAGGRRWLRDLIPDVASGARVSADKQKRRWSGYAPDRPAMVWVNVAFSRAGLEALGASGVDEFSAAFREGMAARAGRLRDPDPEGWLLGGAGAPATHALLIVAAESRERLDAEIARQRTRLTRHGVRDVLSGSPDHEICRGDVLPGRFSKHEHFGFRDGISQPALDGSDNTMPGNVVLGHPDRDGATIGDGPKWAEDGSYLVFRRLRQDVFGFRKALERAARAASLTPDQLAAKLVGRWKSGARLGETLEPWDPGLPSTPGALDYADRFASDAKGERAPLFSHVRKAYPRDARNAERHRLLRRGIAYGPMLDLRAIEDDGRDRGLLFVAYQADIAQQFEHVQRQLNDPNVPRRAAGSDPLAGQPGPHRVDLPEPGARDAVSLSFNAYVTMTGGGYFFSPSIPALAHLANPTDSWAERKAVMGSVPDDRTRLGNFICEENPYPWPLNLSTDFDQPGSPRVYRAGLGKHADQGTPFRVVELNLADPRYMEGLFWSLGGDRTYRVSKAVRIEYDYTFPDGTTKTHGIIIGFEGGGGGM